MDGLRAKVRGGRLLLDAATTLPEGTEIELVLADGGDDLDDAERARLHAAIEAAETDIDQGRFETWDEVIARLRRR